jgi:predicted  nucleic acid-binding Zn-ribbon protein
MTDAPSANADLIARLRKQADDIDNFNEHLRKSGTPEDGLQRNWQRAAADALAAADAEIARWKQHHDDQVRKKRNLSDRYKKALADFIDKNGG